MQILCVLLRSGRVRDAIIVSLLMSLAFAPTMRAASDVHRTVAHADSHASHVSHLHGSSPEATGASEGEVESPAHRLLHLPTCSDAGSLPCAMLPFGILRPTEGLPSRQAALFVPSRQADLPYRPPIVS